ncbi:MAG: hypothetical protein ACYS80_27790 [Planctomycetota bacterium]|jgi:hypothetical protein
MSDFVFLDDDSRPYQVKEWGGDPWLFYWHADKKWVSLRMLRPYEIMPLESRKLPPEMAALYNEVKKAKEAAP